MDKFWKFIIALFIIGMLAGPVVKMILGPQYPTNVRTYQYRYKQMSDPEYKKFLIEYTEEMNNSIEGLNYLELLGWEHRYLKYVQIKREGGLWVYPDGKKYQFRPELPVEIILMGKGACGEFTLLYTGLCLANNIKVRIISDCSIKTSKTDNRTVGDHTWVEVWVEEYKEVNGGQIIGTWLHVDPTEWIINKPYWYTDLWNKNVNLVYAINGTEIVDVTDRYV